MVHEQQRVTQLRSRNPRRAGPAGGYRLVAKDFDTRIEEVDSLGAAPDFVTTFPPGLEGYIAAHDEAVAYLEDVIADCLETLKDLKDSRWINAQELSRAVNR